MVEDCRRVPGAGREGTGHMRRLALMLAAVAATATVSTAATADVMGPPDGDGLSPGSPCYDAESFHGGSWQEWHDLMEAWMGHEGAMPIYDDANSWACTGDHDRWHDRMHDGAGGHMDNDGGGHHHGDVDGFRGGCHGPDAATG